MSKNQINITKESELLMIKAVLLKSEKAPKNNEDLINKCIEMLYSAMKLSDEETHLALFGIDKQF